MAVSTEIFVYNIEHTYGTLTVAAMESLRDAIKTALNGVWVATFDNLRIGRRYINGTSTKVTTLQINGVVYGGNRVWGMLETLSILADCITKIGTAAGVTAVGNAEVRSYSSMKIDNWSGLSSLSELVLDTTIAPAPEDDTAFNSVASTLLTGIKDWADFDCKSFRILKRWGGWEGVPSYYIILDRPAYLGNAIYADSDASYALMKNAVVAKINGISGFSGTAINEYIYKTVERNP